MSDNFLSFVPVDPHWQPTQAAADDAVRFLESSGLGFECVSATFSETVEFHHPCENWSGVLCPSCRADLEEWFNATVRTMYERNQPIDLDITTPCCGLTASLNDLDFLDGPAAFGRFAIEMMNPRVSTTEAQEKTIAAYVGCDLRKVWMRL